MSVFTRASAAIDKSVVRFMERRMAPRTPRIEPADARQRLIRLAQQYSDGTLGLPSPFFPMPDLPAVRWSIAALLAAGAIAGWALGPAALVRSLGLAPPRSIAAANGHRYVIGRRAYLNSARSLRSGSATNHTGPASQTEAGPRPISVRV